MIKKLKVLKKGDLVGIVAPGALFNREVFKAGVARLKEMGLVPVIGKNVFKKDFLFAGTVEQRKADFMAMARRKDIKAIWCVRGGGGSYAVAQEVARYPVPASPKLVIGLSDITALHLLLTQKWKWPCLHGPLLDRMGSPLHGGLEKKTLVKTLFEPDFRLEVTKGLSSMGKKGKVCGPLTGGNLALIAASLGSKWEIQTDRKILFLEEVYEPAYRIDRLLVQLESAGKFQNIKALVFGDFSQCGDSDGKERWREVLQRHFARAKFPVLLGVKSGHGKLRLPLLMGLKAEVSTRNRNLGYKSLEGLSY